MEYNFIFLLDQTHALEADDKKKNKGETAKRKKNR